MPFPGPRGQAGLCPEQGAAPGPGWMEGSSAMAASSSSHHPSLIPPSGNRCPTSHNRCDRGRESGMEKAFDNLGLLEPGRVFGAKTPPRSCSGCSPGNSCPKPSQEPQLGGPAPSSWAQLGFPVISLLPPPLRLSQQLLHLQHSSVGRGHWRSCPRQGWDPSPQRFPQN